MTAIASQTSLQLHIGVVLFDETHSRVFAVRGYTIEDAREFTVYAEASGFTRTRTGRLVYDPEWLQNRAHRTAQQVTALHESRRFEALIVCGPRRLRDLLYNSLPADLWRCPIVSPKLAVMAGETAILAATLAAAPDLERRWARIARAQVPAGARTKAFSAPVPLSSLQAPYHSFATAAAPSRSTQTGVAQI